MKLGEIVKLDIVGTASDGRGIGKLDNFVVFVHGALQGDVVLAKLYTVHKTYATAGVTCIITPSPFRQESICAVSAECGGCPLSHIQYTKQLKIKQQTVTDALTRIGGFDLTDVEIAETQGMEQPFGYRNKMVFPVGYKEGKVVGGFYAPKSHDIIPLTVCCVGETVASEILDRVVRWMNDKHIAPYDEKKKQGTLRRVFIRTGYVTKELMVVLSSYTKRIPYLEELKHALLQMNFGEYQLKSMILNINEKGNNLVLGEKNITLWGEDVIYDKLMGLTFSISPHSFFQINPIQTQVLYQTAIELARLDSTQTVLDVYCGIGTISLFAAKHAKQVIGVEIVESAILNARENAVQNHVTNATFYCGAAEQIVPKLIADGNRPDVVILDPPRKGSDEKTLSAILEAKPQRIVYVSCNPATLARDLRVLAEDGYQLKQVVPVDMFPHTSHVETVVLLSKESRDNG